MFGRKTMPRLAVGATVIAGVIMAGVAWGSASSGPGVRPPSPGPAVARGVICPAQTTVPPPACGVYAVARVAADGTVLGVTATGQASVRGQGTQARDLAIRQAVADARDQAQAAADAAGVRLGSAIDIQVSAGGYAYPLEGAAGVSGAAVSSGPAGASGAAGSSSASGDSSNPITISPGKPAPVPSGRLVPMPPVPVQTFVTVTVTWAIAA